MNIYNIDNTDLNFFYLDYKTTLLKAKIYKSYCTLINVNCICPKINCKLCRFPKWSKKMLRRYYENI